jgi:transketolase
MRNTFAESLTNLQESRKDLLLIYGDIGNKLFDNYKAKKDSKYVNAGIAEASMISIAAGAAKGGLIPIVYTINSFLYLKSIEQIKLDVAYPQLPVIMIGTGGGFSYSELGTTHHSLEDLGMLSTIPNLNILNPADNVEMAASLSWALNIRRPTYIRIGKKGEKTIHTTDLKIQTEKFGPFQIINHEDSTSAILSTGTISYEALQAAKEFNKMNHIDFWSVPQIKEICPEFISTKLSKYSKIFIVEEHNPYGGLGSIISYKLNGIESVKPKIIFINTQDVFHSGSGSINQIREKLGTASHSILERINAN